LVENAFKYVGGDYHISIDASLQGSTIRLEVDNGVPVEIPIKKVNNEGGIGLESLQRRLELLYPDKHTLTAQKKENTFVAVLTLKLPEAAAQYK
jgi:two-component system, LytTR family, sensor kinase